MKHFGQTDQTVPRIPIQGEVHQEQYAKELAGMWFLGVWVLMYSTDSAIRPGTYVDYIQLEKDDL